MCNDISRCAEGKDTNATSDALKGSMYILRICIKRKRSVQVYNKRCTRRKRSVQVQP